MAWANSSNTYHSNAVPGWANGIAESSIYDIDSKAKFAVGTGFKRADGNIYRYCNFITATTQGKLVSQVIADVTSKSADALLIAPAAAYQQSSETPGVYPGAIGSRFVYYTLASVVAGQFAGGYLVLNKDTGVGYTYRIKNNTASATVNAVANLVLIELYEPIVVAIDATTDCAVIGSLYNDVKAASAGTDYVVVGVTQANMTANTYGWVCTHGVTGCLQSDSATSGDVIQLSPTVAGAYCTAGVGTTTVAAMIGQQIIGYLIDAPAGGSTSYGTIFLQIE